MAIQAAHYGETEQRLISDPIIGDMVGGLIHVPRAELAHDTGTPRFEFMQAANHEYRSRGGTGNGNSHIGAVANVLLRLLNALDVNPTPNSKDAK